MGNLRHSKRFLRESNIEELYDKHQFHPGHVGGSEIIIKQVPGDHLFQARAHRSGSTQSARGKTDSTEKVINT